MTRREETCPCGEPFVEGHTHCTSCGRPRAAAPPPVSAPVQHPAAEFTPLLGVLAAPSSGPQHTTLLAPVKVDEPPTLLPGDISPDLFPASETKGASESEPTLLAKAPARRLHRNRWLRYAPLVLTLLVGGAGFAFVLLKTAPKQAAASLPDAVPATLGETVAVPPATVSLGLSEDNKEAVLALCHRLSEHPTVECRRQYLAELGEYPARQASFGALRVDRFEVTNASWANCQDAGACPVRALDECAFYTVARGRELRSRVPETMLAPELPAICVTAAEAESFCRWRHMRLPTADEWERVARSGDDRLLPWGSFMMPGLMNWGERILGGFPIPGRVDGFELTAPVDEYRSGATDEGVHNMLGNVEEWVVDILDDGSRRYGRRGGSYVDDALEMRTTLNREASGDERRSTLGFRCIR